MQKTGGLSHWHGNHEGRLHKPVPTWDWLKRFAALASDLQAEGVEVVNLTRETALECFKRGDIERFTK